ADPGRVLTIDSIDLRVTGCTGDGGGSACNTVTNPGFEESTAGWFSNVTPELVADSAEGTQAVSITGGWISHVVPVVPGSSYSASALVKSTGSSGWSGTGLDFVDSSGTKLADVTQTIGPATAYGPVLLSGVAPVGAAEVQFWFYADTGRTTQVDAVDLRITGCTGDG
ncbi:MAG: hypothetical protein WA888_00750, partial [Burkholderiaceae bacterium]